MTPEQRQALSDRAKAKWADPEFRKKIQERQREASKRPEVKEKRSQALLKRWASGDMDNRKLPGPRTKKPPSNKPKPTPKPRLKSANGGTVVQLKVKQQ